MAWVSRWVAQCDVCGKEWLPEKDPEEFGDPKQCTKCKTRHWNSGKTHPVEPAEPPAGEIREKFERIAAGIVLDSDRTPTELTGDPEPGGPLCPVCQEHILVRHKDGWGCNDCNLAFTRTDRRMKGWL
jgi:hypothetical protein